MGNHKLAPFSQTGVSGVARQEEVNGREFLTGARIPFYAAVCNILFKLFCFYVSVVGLSDHLSCRN